MTTTASTGSTASTASTGTARTSRRHAAALVVGAAVLGAVLPTTPAHAAFPARVQAPTVVTTSVPTAVPCFIGHLEWQDAIAGPAPQCDLLP